jgi:hypothetical protein
MYCRLGHLHTNPRLFFHDFCDASTCRENVSSRLESKLGAHNIHNICKFNWTVQCKLFNCCYTKSIQEFTCDFHAEIQLNRFFRFRAEILHSESVTSASILSALSRHKSKCKSVQGASALSSLKKKWAPLSGSMEARIPRCQLTCPFKLVWISAILGSFMVGFNEYFRNRSTKSQNKNRSTNRSSDHFALNLFWQLIFRQQEIMEVWQKFWCAYVLSLLSWLVFLEISGFDGICGSNRNLKHPLYPDCNW